MKPRLDNSLNRMMGIPRRYWDIYLDEIITANDEQSMMRDKLMMLERGEKKSLCVLGTVGNGKTMLASAFLSLHELNEPYTTKYITQEELIEKCRATFSEDSFNSEATVLKPYMTSKVLVIDELTTRNWTDYTKYVVQRIISRRYDYYLTTVLIGNLDVATFKGMFDAHILSRLREGETHLMTAPDMRLHGDF